MTYFLNYMTYLFKTALFYFAAIVLLTASECASPKPKLSPIVPTAKADFSVRKCAHKDKPAVFNPGEWNICSGYFTKEGLICVVCSDDNSCYDERHGIYCANKFTLEDAGAFVETGDNGVSGDVVVCAKDPNCILIQP